MAHSWKLLIAAAAGVALLGGCASTGPRAVFSAGNEVAQDFGSSSYNLGKQYLAAGQYGLAVQQFHVAQARDPNSIEVLNGLAATYDNLGRFDLAERYYREALNLNPMSAQTLNNIGYSYLLRGKYDLAVTFLRDASNTERRNPVVIANHQAAVNRLVAGESPLPQVADAALPADAPTPDVPFVPHIDRVAESVQSLITRPDSTTPRRSQLAPSRLVRVVYRTDEPLVPEDNNQEPMPNIAMAEAPASQLPGPRTEAGRTFPFAARTPTARERATSVAARRQDAAMRPIQVAGRAPAAHTAEALAGEMEAVARPIALLAGLPTTEYAPGPVARGTPVSLIARGGANRVAAARADGSPRALFAARLTEAEQDQRATARPVALLVARNGGTNLDAEPVRTARRDEGRPRMLLAARRLDEPLTVRLSQDAIFMDEGDTSSVFDMSGAVIEVANGTGRRSMAARMRSYLETTGIDVARLTNADHYRHFETTIYYRAGWHKTAKDVSFLLPAFVDLAVDEEMRSDIRIELGGDLLNFDYHLYLSDLKTANGRAG